MPRTPRTTPKILDRATQLRNDPTSAEAKLWAYLRLKRTDRVRFRRQEAIGRFVVDFCAPESKLVIELDGSQHLQRIEQDSDRTHYLESRGYRVLRFWNDQVLNDIDGVVAVIQQALGAE
jgi:very-short-patch-repair endonuclease